MCLRRMLLTYLLMKIDGITYELDWRELTVGSSFFIPCVGVTKGREVIERKMKRLGYTIIVRVVIEDNIRGLRVWRKKRYTTAAT